MPTIRDEIAKEDATRKANKQIAAVGLTSVRVYECECLCVRACVIQLFKQPATTTTATGHIL